MAHLDEVADYKVKRFIEWRDEAGLYLGVDPVNGENVLLRVFMDDLPEANAARIEREHGRIIAVRHKNITRVHCCGWVDEQLYIASEFVDWNSLADNLDGSLVAGRAFILLNQAAAGLAAMAKAELCHGALRPESFLIGSDDSLKITELSIRHVDEDRSLPGAERYYSPELHDGAPVSLLTDMYALGAVFYHVLSGSPPPVEDRPKLKSKRTDLPSRLCAVIERLMAIDPNDRFQSYGELLLRLDKVREQIKFEVVQSEPQKVEDEPSSNYADGAEEETPREPQNDYAPPSWTPERARNETASLVPVYIFVSLTVVCIIALLASFRTGTVEENLGVSAKLVTARPTRKRTREKRVRQAKPVGQWTANDIGMKMVWIPPGSFMMGNSWSLSDVNKPKHLVVIKEGFWIGASEVTQEEWEKVMGNNPSKPVGKRLPVNCVSWRDCQIFCRKLSKMDSKEYRLPTEAEWEYACKGRTMRDEPDVHGMDEYVWHSGNSSGRMQIVRGKPPTSAGLFDVLGNVAELCQDGLRKYSYGTVVDPVGETKERAVRGGAFCLDAGKCGPTERWAIDPDDRAETIGFRVVATTLGWRGPVAQHKLPDDEGLHYGRTPLSSGKNLAGVAPKTLLDKMNVQTTVESTKTIKKESNTLFMKMVWIPAGKFRMGTSGGLMGRLGHGPRHLVTLTRGFWMSVTEVTQAQWNELMKDNPSKEQGGSFPVNNVTWGEAQHFCKLLSKKEKAKYRLPTEAEWEYACRAGYKRDIGGRWKENANLRKNLKSVGSYKPNAFGLCDMIGNVAELCYDGKRSYELYDVTDPKGPIGIECAVRGASAPKNSVSPPAYRLFQKTKSRSPRVGFRVVRE